MTCRGLTLGTALRRLDISTLEKMDSPEDTKIAAPRSWKTEKCQLRGLCQ
jgi:hypothetical protein